MAKSSELSVERKVIVSVAIRHEGKILFTKQSKKARHSGKWGLPGGNLEPDENSLEKAARREVMEEVGLNLQDLKLLDAEVVLYEGNLQLIFMLYGATCDNPEVRLNEEIDDYQWLTVNDLEKFPRENIRFAPELFDRMLEKIAAVA